MGSITSGFFGILGQGEESAKQPSYRPAPDQMAIDRNKAYATEEAKAHAGTGPHRNIEEEVRLETLKANIASRSTAKTERTSWMMNAANSSFKTYEEVVKKSETDLGRKFSKSVRPSWYLVASAFANKETAKSAAAFGLTQLGYGFNRATMQDTKSEYGKVPSSLLKPGQEKWYAEPNLYGMYTKRGEVNGGFRVEGRIDRYYEAKTRRNVDEKVLQAVQATVSNGEPNAMYGILGINEKGRPIFARGADIHRKSYERAIRYILENPGDMAKQLDLYAEDIADVKRAVANPAHVRQEPEDVVVKVTGQHSKANQPQAFAAKRTHKFTPLRIGSEEQQAMQTRVLTLVEKIAEEQGVSLNENHKKVILSNILNESNFNPEAEGDLNKLTGEKESIGLGQINMKAHWEALGLDEASSRQHIEAVKKGLKDPEDNLRFLLTKANNGGAFNNKGFMEGKNLEEMNKAFVAKTMRPKDIPGDTKKRLKSAREFSKRFTKVDPAVKPNNSISVIEGGEETPTNDGSNESNYFERTNAAHKTIKLSKQSDDEMRKVLNKPSILLGYDDYDPEALVRVMKSLNKMPHITNHKEWSVVTKAHKLVDYHNKIVERNKNYLTTDKIRTNRIEQAAGPDKNNPIQSVVTIDDSGLFEGYGIPFTTAISKIESDIDSKVASATGKVGLKGLPSQKANAILKDINSWLKAIKDTDAIGIEKMGAPQKGWARRLRSSYLHKNKFKLEPLIKKLENIKPLKPNGMIASLHLEDFDELMKDDHLRGVLRNTLQKRSSELSNEEKFKTLNVVNFDPGKNIKLHQEVTPMSAEQKAEGGFFEKRPHIGLGRDGSKEPISFQALENIISPLLTKFSPWIPSSDLTTEQQQEQQAAIKHVRSLVKSYSKNGITAEELATALLKDNPGLLEWKSAMTSKIMVPLVKAVGNALGHHFIDNNTFPERNGNVTVNRYTSDVTWLKEDANPDILKESNHIMKNAVPISGSFSTLEFLMGKAGGEIASIASLPVELQDRIRNEIKFFTEDIKKLDRGELTGVLEEEAQDKASILEKVIEELEERSNSRFTSDGKATTPRERKQAGDDARFLKQWRAQEGGEATGDLAGVFDRLFEKWGSFWSGLTRHASKGYMGMLDNLRDESFSWTGREHLIKNKIGQVANRDGKTVGWHKTKKQIGDELRDKQEAVQKRLQGILTDDSKSVSEKYIAQIQAQRTFLAIQLTYQYAGMVQGGSGGRAISNEDFQNLYKALWGGTGELTKSRLNAARLIVNKSIAIASVLKGVSHRGEPMLNWMESKIGNFANAVYMKKFEEQLRTIRNVALKARPASEVKEAQNLQIRKNALTLAGNNIFGKGGFWKDTGMDAEYLRKTPMQDILNNLNSQLDTLDSDDAKVLSTRSGINIEAGEHPRSDLMMAKALAEYRQNESRPSTKELEQIGIMPVNVDAYQRKTWYELVIEGMRKGSGDSKKVADHFYEMVFRPLLIRGAE